VTTSHVMVTGRVVDPRSTEPGRRIIGATETEGFPEALGHAANLSEMTDAGQQEGEQSSARHRDIAGAMASTPAPSSGRTDTAVADSSVRPQTLPRGEPDNLPSETVPMQGTAVLESDLPLPPEAAPGGTAAPSAPSSAQAFSRRSGRTVSAEHRIGARQAPAEVRATAPRARLAGRDMSVRSLQNPQISDSDPSGQEGAQQGASDRSDGLGGLRLEASAASAQKAWVRLSSGTRKTERAGALALGFLGTSASALGNTVSPATLTWPAGSGGEPAAAGPVSGNAAPTDRVDSSARSVHPGDAQSNPTSADLVPQHASGRQTSTTDPTVDPGPKSHSQSADTIGPGQSAAERVPQHASGPQISTTDPTVDPSPMSRSQSVDTAGAGQSAADRVPQHRSGPQTSTTDPTVDPSPMSRSQSADAASAGQSTADPAPQDASGPQTSTTDPTVDPSPMSRSQSGDTAGLGQSAADPTSPQTHPTIATKVVGSDLADSAHTAMYRAGDAGPGSHSGAPLAAAAASPPATAAGAPGGLPVARSIAATAQLSLGELPDALFRHVVGSMGNPGNEVVLYLHPPELGDLTVRVLVSGREVSAWFGTPQVEVQQVISQALGKLHTDLGNAGYTLGSAWVGADPGAGERGSRAPVPPFAQKPIAGAKPIASAASTAPIRSSSSGVSVYV
jgi:Flagellar hook-length control protein FliK